MMDKNKMNKRVNFMLTESEREILRLKVKDSGLGSEGEYLRNLIKYENIVITHDDEIVGELLYKMENLEDKITEMDKEIKLFYKNFNAFVMTLINANAKMISFQKGVDGKQIGEQMAKKYLEDVHKDSLKNSKSKGSLEG